MFAVCRPLESPFLPRDKLVLAHQAFHAVPPDLVSLIQEVAVHAENAIGAVRQGEGRPDMSTSCCWRRQAGRSCQAKKPLWLTPKTRHIRRIGKLAFSSSMKPMLIDFPLSQRRPRLFLRMSRSCYRTPFSRRNLFSSACRSTEASLGASNMRFLAQPSRQSRQANARILRDLSPRPAAGQCQPNRFTPKPRRRSVPVSHGTPYGSSVGALHIFRARPTRPRLTSRGP